MKKILFYLFAGVLLTTMGVNALFAVITPTETNFDPVNLSVVELAIKEGCAEYTWMPRNVGGNVIEATLKIRTHTAVVSIPYTTTGYKIIYKDSINLNYDGNSIHNNYYGWVKNIDRAIYKRICAAPTQTMSARYNPMLTIQLSPKNVQDIEILPMKATPLRAFIFLGYLTIGAETRLDPTAFAEEARTKAAALGADFVVLSEENITSHDYQIPAYASWGWNWSNANGGGSGSGSFSGGYTVNKQQQNALYYIGVYCPSRLGFSMENGVIEKFSRESNAPEAGLQVGDKIESLGECPLTNTMIFMKMLNWQAGEEISVDYSRDAEKFTTKIKLIPNK